MKTAARSFKASVDSLEPIRDFVSEQCAEAGFDHKKTFKLCLAIDEIATNIIRYGYPQAGVQEGVGDLEVTISSGEGRLSVGIQDMAIAFNPLQYLIPTEEDMHKPLEERPVGGLGIMLAQQNVDEFNYYYQDGMNHNILAISK